MDQKLKKRYEDLLGELQFGFTTLHVTQKIDGKREPWVGEWLDLLHQVQTVLWIHKSARREKIYTVGQLPSGEYIYLRANLNWLEFLDNAGRITISKDLNSLVEKEMSKHARKVYKRKSIAIVSSSSHTLVPDDRSHSSVE